MIYNDIITNPCDVDFYKITMKAAIHKCYPEVEAEFAFTCRSPGIDFTSIINEVERQLNVCLQLTYDPTYLRFLESQKNPKFSNAFISFLRSQSWHRTKIRVALNADKSMDIRVRGIWKEITDWEIWTLAIVSECWSRYQIDQLSTAQRKEYDEDRVGRMMANINLLQGYPDLKFVDFGTRRRSSKIWHEQVLRMWMECSPQNLLGTSNVMLACDLGLPVFGTHAHEWDCAHLAFTNASNAKSLAMKVWMESFGGEAGITLTDTFTTKHFLKVFNRHMANSFTGVRHDSGPWKSWGDAMIRHYQSLGIDPMTKTLLFSDGLDFPTMIEIYMYFKGRIKVKMKARIGFGCGTKVTNDTMIPALQIVMKMVSCNGLPVMKISDEPGKMMCEYPWFSDYMLNTFDIVQNCPSPY